MDVGAAFVAGAQPLERVRPGEAAFDDPAGSAQAEPCATPRLDSHHLAGRRPRASSHPQTVRWPWPHSDLCRTSTRVATSGSRARPRRSPGANAAVAGKVERRGSLALQQVVRLAPG